MRKIQASGKCLFLCFKVQRPSYRPIALIYVKFHKSEGNFQRHVWNTSISGEPQTMSSETNNNGEAQKTPSDA
jgi:hypothetical protein